MDPLSVFYCTKFLRSYSRLNLFFKKQLNVYITNSKITTISIKHVSKNNSGKAFMIGVFAGLNIQSLLLNSN